jgi:dolichyl-diphosphooligosaccharide--protein glycosyltransferase
MVSTWGGYVFVTNLIAFHAASMVLLKPFDFSLYRAYSLWYIVGSLGAIQIPVVGWAPFRSMEQLLPFSVFLAFQVLQLVSMQGRRQGLTFADNSLRTTAVKALSVLGFVLLGLISIGWFGPLPVRVRSLFIQHTRTGNPLVDSVAEHQATSASAYWSHLHYAVWAAPVGLVMAFFPPRFAAKWFVVIFGLIAYYFANKMNRLIILMGPISSVLSGLALANMLEWSFDQVMALSDGFATADGTAAAAAGAAGVEDEKKKKPAGRKDPVAEFMDPFVKFYRSSPGRLLRVGLSLVLIYYIIVLGSEFWVRSHYFAEQMSQPQLMFKTRARDGGGSTIISDYYDSYRWIKENTPVDARILSWWDYGYQIAGISNRTTLADGNTWNLEHIALIGRILVSSEEKAHNLAKHLADYVLVWAGGGSDDLAKSPHMARISSSVFDICGRHDPLCKSFGFTSDGKGGRQPTPLMEKSLLYKLHSSKLTPGVTVNSNLFEEVHRSKHGLVRIYKILGVNEESKRWCADPSNRVCDHPGSWFCRGQYPPALPKPPGTHRDIDYSRIRDDHYEDEE